MLKHFSNQTRAGRRQRRARQAALKGALSAAIRALGAAKAALPDGLRKSGPWAVSAAINLALFTTLFFYGVPRIVVDTSEAIQVTVTSFFVDTPAPEKPEGGGGGAGGESLSEALASFEVEPETAPATSVAAITSVHPQALDLALPQTDITAPKIDGALIAKTVAAAKAAPAPQSTPTATVAKAPSPGTGTGSGTGGGDGKGKGPGKGNGSGKLPPGFKRVGNLTIDTKKLLVVSYALANGVGGAFGPWISVPSKLRGDVEWLGHSPEAALILQNDFTRASVEAVTQKIEEMKPVTVLWVGAMYHEHPAAVARLRELILSKGIKFYLMSCFEKPSRDLEALCAESGGEFEQARLDELPVGTVRLKPGAVAGISQDSVDAQGYSFAKDGRSLNEVNPAGPFTGKFHIFYLRGPAAGKKPELDGMYVHVENTGVTVTLTKDLVEEDSWAEILRIYNDSWKQREIRRNNPGLLEKIAGEVETGERLP